MDDAAARGHPLHIAAFEVAAIAEMVFMQHVTIEHIGHGFKAAVRMTGKTGDVIVGVFRAELVEHQKGIEPRLRRLADAPAQFDAGAIRGRL